MGRVEEVADDDDESAPSSGSLDDRVVAALVAHSKTDEPDVHFVLLHRNANSGRGQLNALKKGKATVTDCKTPTRKGYTDFVAAEFVSLHRPITPDVPEAMVAAAGRDLRALAAANSPRITPPRVALTAKPSSHSLLVGWRLTHLPSRTRFWPETPARRWWQRDKPSLGEPRDRLLRRPWPSTSAT
jgi:hypothetical protein